LQVVDLVEVTCAASLDLLRMLKLLGNPLRELPDYRLSVIFALPQLIELDTQHIEIAEKVCYITFDKLLNVLSACSGCSFTFHSFCPVLSAVCCLYSDDDMAAVTYTLYLMTKSEMCGYVRTV